MIITEEVFRAFLHCHTKAYLKSIRVNGNRSEFVIWRESLNEEYKLKCQTRFRSLATEKAHFSGSITKQVLDSKKFHFASDCKVEVQEIKTYIHGLSLSSSPGKTAYIPIRFVPHEKITTVDRLLLAFDSHALSLVTGRLPPFGEIVHGREQKTLRVRLAGLMKSVRSNIRKIVEQKNDAPPQLILNKHCIECEFQQRCRDLALEKDDLSLLNSMHEKERKKQHNRGIFSVTQLSYTFRPRKRSKHVASKPEKYHHSLKALAIRERKIHIAGSPKLHITGTPVYLDIEGVPDRGFYYLVGLRIKDDNSSIQHSLWANNVSEEKKIWKSLLRILSGIENPRLIHFGSYETLFLRQMKERYDVTRKENALADQLIAEATNILSIIYGQIYFPTYSNGLKDIARYLGFRWSEETASGLNSTVWRAKWDVSKDLSLKRKLATYNAEDCAALEKVTATITQLCSQRGDGLQLSNAVYTDSMKRKSSYHFGDNYFSMPELENINRSAYWDYQREKVYVRSSKLLKRIAPKPPPMRHKPLPVNTTIICPPPICCPECHSTSLYKHGISSKVVRDIRFSRTGLKRWVVRYKYYRYICRECAATFYSQPKQRTESKHGWDLLAYIIYQLVELRIPQSTVADSLNQLFGFQLDHATVNRQKTRAAKIYKGTYEEILKKILNGNLIHADETRVNIRGGTGYVWVLTNLEEVVYFYTDTREGEVVQSLLQEFKGVLVSDFYSAYDSINCPQQKCLIHLMRDLNDDLFKHPFNEEFKNLVSSFAELLKPMIDTIDRFGLKARFLRKHRTFVERFFKKLSRAEFKTEIVVKYKKRFEKNRQRLFTFLDHDGVPWNNNNAEHAIKAFVMLRIVIRGSSTEKGIREYLTLLSIYETCGYRGVNFLNFLRSGETNIEEFRRNKYVFG